MRYTKTIRGILCVAIPHGIGWRVSACDPTTGMAHTEYAEKIAEAAEKVVKWLEKQRD